MHSFWDNKKVLVTGHTGFVGSWLCAVLRYFNASVTGFSLPEERNSLYEKIKSELKIHSIYGDLRDAEAIKDCIQKCQPEIVFHIAAFGFVKECFEDPDRAYTTNVQGTLNLFQAVRELKSPCRIVLASSDKVYQNSDMEAYLFREGDSLGGSDPYSASKTCEDILAQSCFESYLSEGGKSLCIIRPSNILGGGDHNINRLIPSIYYKLKHKERPEIRNPNAVRPWQNILDMTDAYLTVAEKAEKEYTVYNVGPEQEGIKTVSEIAGYIAGLYGMEVDGKYNRDGALKEKAYLGLSTEKIKKELGWRPKRTLEQTLTEIYEFYQNDDGDNTYDLCMRQIKGYYTKKEDYDAELE